MSTKQVIVIRTDLNMRKGKMCAQAAHASMAAVFHDSTMKEDLGSWIKTIRIPQGTEGWFNHVETFKKIVVGCESEEEIRKLHQAALDAGIRNATIIVDKGLTEFGGVPTVTALGIGPWDAETIDKITGHLKLL